MGKQHINELRIEHFRGIRKLHIKNLGKVNLLFGSNQCGKTAILEALFMASGAIDPRLLFSLNTRRSVKEDDVRENIKLFFHKKDIEQEITVEIKGQAVSRLLTIKPYYPRDAVQTDFVMASANGIDTSAEQIDGFQLTHKDKLGKNPYNKPNTVYLSQGDSSEKVSISGILGANKFPGAYFELFDNKERGNYKTTIGKWIANGKKDEILDFLKPLEPEINDITFLPDGKLIVQINTPPMLPANITGNGLVQMLKIFSASVVTEAKVILLDECERGLHHSVIETVWKQLLRSAIHHDQQLFITTHSIDMIHSLGRVLGSDADGENEFQEIQDEIINFHIQRHEDNAVGVMRYNANELFDVMENSNDIR